MRTPYTLLLALLVLGLAGFTPDRDKDRDRDRDRNASRTQSTAPQNRGGLQPGSCVLGASSRDLDVNRVQATAFNTGSLFFGGNAEAAYLVPKASGKSPIFASGIWVGGLVNDELRVAGSTYSNFEFWPGPLDPSTGRPVIPGDCSSYDRIYRVSATDILDVQAGADLADPRYDDLRQWPAELGAPVIAALDNGVDEDGDGLVDEGSDGVDNDGDTLVDERDEQEYRTDGGYDFIAGDRPDLIGDQSLWWVMNDVGNTHDNTGAPPVGIEVRVQMFAFDRSNSLGDITFYSYTILYVGDPANPQPLEEAYLSVFSDADLGDAPAAYVGSDTTLSLGFVYNSDNVDAGSAGYGVAPPAVGYDFFQGPIVDGDTLGLTRFSYFINGGPPGTSDPTDLDQYYNVMQGLWTNGLPMRECGIGIACGGDITQYAFAGDPVARDFWSEVAVGASPGDRRFVTTTGPITMQPGDSQEIVFGIVFGQGNSNLSSVAALRAADIVAQSAYDADFEVPSPPPAPEPCQAGNDRLQPGSGDCLESIELDGEVTLVWGYPEPAPGTPRTDTNYLGQFSDLGYDFEGFNVYQYPTSEYDESERVLVATYDEINGIFQVNNLEFNLDVGALTEVPRARGTDSGIQFFYQPEADAFGGEELVNYRDYFFGVSAYAVNLNAPLERVVESSATQITVRPSNIASNAGGSVTQSQTGQILAGTRLGGEGVGAASAIVVDPTRLTGATYTVEIDSVTVDRIDDAGADTTLLTFIIRRDGDVIFNGTERLLEDGLYVPPQPITDLNGANAITGRTGLEVFTGQFIIDGIQFVNAFLPGVPEDADAVADFSGNAGNPDEGSVRGIVETAYPGLDPCDPTAAAADLGCPDYNGNTVWHDANINGDYYVSGGGAPGEIIRLARFIEAAVPDDFEFRYTDEGGYAVYGFEVGTYPITRVPFEIWNIGNTGSGENDPSDDVRMIPFINPNVAGNFLLDWTDTFDGVDAWTGSPCEGGCPITQWVYWMMPDRPGATTSYDLFEQAAIDFGGAGAIYDPAADGDNVVNVDPLTGDPCGAQGVYANYCYDNQVFRNNPPSAFIYPIGRSVFADLAEDGTTPPTGTVVRFITTPKGQTLVAGDSFEFDTSDLVLLTNQQAVADTALATIGVVPNPYLGNSLYETGSLDRRVRFTNLPPQATIRIYTVAGTLIRELSKDGPSRSLDWDLNTFNNLPIASGMYLIHIEARDDDGNEIGEQILKFGVVNRQIDVDVF